MTALAWPEESSPEQERERAAGLEARIVAIRSNPKNPSNRSLWLYEVGLDDAREGAGLGVAS